MNGINTLNMVQRNKSKVVSCSTPEHQNDSPSRDSDSIYDSDAASPVPFLCTQDGAEGITDVVWNYYTPKAEHNGQSRQKNSTPLSRKSKKCIKPKLIEKPPPRRRVLRSSLKKNELLQELLDLNKNLNELISKKTQKTGNLEQLQSGSEEDIFSDSSDRSPKSGLRTNSRCLRKSILSSKFCKPDTETLESDDSMNECLIKASQVVEENVLTKDDIVPPKRICRNDNWKSITGPFQMDNNSMDAIIGSINLDSPIVLKTKNYDKLNNDSFDSLVGNLNDSALERLSQMPPKKDTPNRSIIADWTVKELIVHEGTPSKSFFGRHNSMPESPTVIDNKPSTSGMAFGKYNSMPFNQNNTGDSPIRCTQDEIKRKHQQAREKLLAKRLLPFTATQQSQNKNYTSTQSEHITLPKKKQFQPKVPISTVNQFKQNETNIPVKTEQSRVNPIDIKSLIEKKRQEALMKLRRRQHSK